MKALLTHYAAFLTGVIVGWGLAALLTIAKHADEHADATRAHEEAQ